MTHQVLARKWRPRTFADVTGQQHVVRALSNSLQQQRLHHAYLLTGTRGVGKTTLARILAKCLNCERGITHEPCLVCAHCQAIERGQFMDLIEIDAASRTRVEDTRDLMDNVQYMPTIGRYKVYLIDEVHMLSNHSFNALLKTLEEPPAHVIFILATTDPERLPITVLSRCLQFQLKPMTDEQITQRLAHVLHDEKIPFTPQALTGIARAAEGSMRDALSLCDQVIALGQGNVTEQSVLDLLGGISLEGIVQLIKAVADNQGMLMLNIIQQWLAEGVNFQQALDEVIACLHQISVLQIIQQPAEHPVMAALATQLGKEQVQLYYQIAVRGKQDLPYSPTPRLGFEMTLLRMLAFSPVQPIQADAVSMIIPETVVVAPPSVNSPEQTCGSPHLDEGKLIKTPHQDEGYHSTADIGTEVNSLATAPLDKLDWPTLIPKLALTGPTKVLAEYCLLTQADDRTLTLTVDNRQRAMLTQTSQEKLTQAIINYVGMPVCVKIEIGQADLPCPANIARQRNEAVLQQAEQALLQDPGLNSLLQRFDAIIEPGSVQSTLSEEKST